MSARKSTIPVTIFPRGTVQTGIFDVSDVVERDVLLVYLRNGVNCVTGR